MQIWRDRANPMFAFAVVKLWHKCGNTFINIVRNRWFVIFSSLKYDGLSWLPRIITNQLLDLLIFEELRLYTCS